LLQLMMMLTEKSMFLGHMQADELAVPLQLLV
jgi:hypothetical protein